MVVGGCCVSDAGTIRIVHGCLRVGGETLARMSAASIKSATAAALNVLFDVAGELVVDSAYNRVSGPFYDALTKPVQQVNSCRTLIMNFHRLDIDGVVINVDDERGFVRTSEVPADV